MTTPTQLAPRQSQTNGALAQHELDTLTLGKVFAQSGYFKDARDQAQAVVKILAGAELGIPAVASMTGIYIVKERITLSANPMGAIIKRSGRYDYRVRELSATIANLEFFQRIDGKWEVIGESVFTWPDAVAAGLAGGDNWRKHPRNMLFARALSNGAKWHCPDVFAGGPIYTPEELGADVDGETGEILRPAGGGGTWPKTAPVTTVEATPEPAGEPDPLPDPDPDFVPAEFVEDTARLTGKPTAPQRPANNPSVRRRYELTVKEAEQAGLTSIPTPTEDTPDSHIIDMGKRLRERIEARTLGDFAEALK
ncbi:MAG TPA: hypothetical protein VNM48_14730 [Chloroflexota bacterium]|nr:hypothetical protein [Chloroflexota bacterium]